MRGIKLVVATVLLFAATTALPASPAAAGTGGCSFSGQYGVKSMPGANNFNVAGTRAAVIGPLSFINTVGCAGGVAYVTGVPVSGVSGTTVRTGTPFGCTFTMPAAPEVGTTPYCGVTVVPTGVEVNEVQILLTAYVSTFALNGGHAEAVASCLVTWSSYGDTVGAAGPRCPISG